MQDLDWNELAELAPEWEKLALSAPEPFFQPYWLLAFSAMFPAPKKVTVLTVQDPSGLKGILPLTRETTFFNGIPAHTLRSLSGTHSCRFDLVCDERSRLPATRAIWNALRDDPSWDVIEALNVPADGSFQALQDSAREDGFLTAAWPTLRMPYLELPQQNADPFGNSPGRYSSFRRRLETYQRKLARNGKLAFGVHRDFTDRIFYEFLNLEASGWKKHTGGAIAQKPQVRQFYLQALQGPLVRGIFAFTRCA